MHSNNRGDSVFGSKWCSGDKAWFLCCQSRRVDSLARTLFVSLAVLPHSPCGFSQRAPEAGLVRTAKLRMQHFCFRRAVRVAVLVQGTPELRVEFCTQTGREGWERRKAWLAVLPWSPSTRVLFGVVLLQGFHFPVFMKRLAKASRRLESRRQSGRGGILHNLRSDSFPSNVRKITLFVSIVHQ